MTRQYCDICGRLMSVGAGTRMLIQVSEQTFSKGIGDTETAIDICGRCFYNIMSKVEDPAGIAKDAIINAAEVWEE